jgi:hypothetical protein
VIVTLRPGNTSNICGGMHPVKLTRLVWPSEANKNSSGQVSTRSAKAPWRRAASRHPAPLRTAGGEPQACAEIVTAPARQCLRRERDFA